MQSCIDFFQIVCEVMWPRLQFVHHAFAAFCTRTASQCGLAEFQAKIAFP